jgi:hypothetical protein
LAALQVRLEPVAGGLHAEAFERLASHPLKLFGERGKPRRDKVLLDGRFVEVRLVDLELRLCRRAAPPFTADSAAVLYMLAIPIGRMGGNMQRRADLQGSSYFYKVGAVTSSSWLSRGLLADLSDDEQWLRRAVAYSYQHRVKGHKFWKQICGDAVALHSMVPLVLQARLLSSEEAIPCETALGQALERHPGVVALRDTTRWCAPDERGGSFWHFAGPLLEATSVSDLFGPA